MANAEAFANKLRLYLQVISKDRPKYGLKHGKLVDSQLHRVPLAIPGYSERVFKRDFVHMRAANTAQP